MNWRLLLLPRFYVKHPLGLCLLLIAIAVTMSVYIVRREQVCYAHGFAEYRGGFCFRRVNGTDSTVALNLLDR